jgi:tRNA A37 N6-isopentenylltransferase MiaA
MKVFRVNKEIEIICDWKKTNYGFKHEARLMVNGMEHQRAKCCYYNRTWESFEYESVIQDLLHKTSVLTKRQKTIFMKKANGDEHKAVQKKFGMIGAIASLGNILCDTQKDKNDWKSRMIKAGMGEGLIMPDDWDTLSEDDKETRLNNALKEIGGK